MKLDTIGDVIATRRLFLVNDPNWPVIVKMGKPQPLPDAVGDEHYCPIQITGLGSEKVKYATGLDAFQSIELALRLIGIEVAVLNREYHGQLRWWDRNEQHGNLGFPFPEAFRKQT
jgi:hypothetical protein